MPEQKKKNPYPKQFYVMANEMANDVNTTEWPDEYIFHSRKPQFMAVVKVMEDKISEMELSEAEISHAFTYINPDGILELYQLIIVQKFDETISNEKYYSKLKRASDWYGNYLVWQDKQNINVGGQVGYLSDYNDNTPGLKIIFNNTQWAVIYNGIVKVFDNEFEMDEFIERLGIKSEDLDEGIINTF